MTPAVMAYRRPIAPARIASWTLLFLGGVIMVTPLLWMFSTSLKYPHEVYDLKLIPDEPAPSQPKKVQVNPKPVPGAAAAPTAAPTPVLHKIEPQPPGVSPPQPVIKDAPPRKDSLLPR